jgi:SagB-type dehydrogenase family enzyme
VTVSGEDGTFAEDSASELLQWEFHDLLFHAYSRRGLGYQREVGASFPLRGRLDPAPAVKTAVSGNSIALHVPETAKEPDGLSFEAVLGRRRTVREHGSVPISLVELGDFLYRSASVSQLVERNESAGVEYPTSSRPYPSAGGAYELEIYLSIGSCAGLDPGLFHYDPVLHCLRGVGTDNAAVAEMLRRAGIAGGITGEPHVLLTLSCRLLRLSWKYRSIAYALALKDAGVLIQSMYLVATAMGLAPCALGTGESDLFAAAVGIPAFAEPSIGEILIGGRLDR